MIAGLVLAAGRSRRMGAAKPLLEVEGKTFLAHVVQALRGGGCGEVMVVVGSQQEETADRIAEAARDEGAQVAVNPLEEAEQIDSLRVGLQALSPEVEAAVVTPVDFPRTTAQTVGTLITSFHERGAPIVLPVYRGRRGHPVLFGRAIFPEFFADPLPEGARSVVHAHAADLLEVPVEEPGVLLDVDTPADYRRLLNSEG